MRRCELVGLFIGVVSARCASPAARPHAAHRRAHGRNCRRYGELSAVNRLEQRQLTREAAELYERYPARYILDPWVPLLVDAARLEAGERVLDVACGTGVVTRAAAIVGWNADVVTAPAGAFFDVHTKVQQIVTELRELYDLRS
jgi:2-polyprenyl-3-methyl-5-hydroxy-6-metoxy-1,4-benzoquinol methylase